MPTPWRSMPPDFPADAATVWVRRWWFGNPFQAVWRNASQDFLYAGAYAIGWQFIARWRPL